VKRQEIEAKQEAKLQQLRVDIVTERQRAQEAERRAREEEERAQLEALVRRMHPFCIRRAATLTPCPFPHAQTAAWRAQRQHEAAFLATTAVPSILYRPRKLLPAHEQQLEARRAAVDARLAQGQAQAAQRQQAAAAARETARAARATHKRAASPELTLTLRSAVVKPVPADGPSAVLDPPAAAEVAAPEPMAEDGGNAEPTNDYLISADADDQS
jgi:hypothetical protein